jgi:hypothetical protein
MQVSSAIRAAARFGHPAFEAVLVESVSTNDTLCSLLTSADILHTDNAVWHFGDQFFGCDCACLDQKFVGRIQRTKGPRNGRCEYFDGHHKVKQKDCRYCADAPRKRVKHKQCRKEAKGERKTENQDCCLDLSPGQLFG